MVRDRPDEVWRALDAMAAAYAVGGRTHYYEVRDVQFNPLRERRRGGDGRIAYTPELAAMLIYLNRTGFNGLFRLNASGAYNVPAGRYERPAIADRARARGTAASSRSSATSAWRMRVRSAVSSCGWPAFERAPLSVDGGSR
jgi:DNA adenine methylase